MLKHELEKKVIELEEELHTEQNSSEYWSHEYHNLLKEYEKIKTSDNPIVNFLNTASIVDYDKVINFINSLK